jgi:hypothetical protein
MTCDEYDAALLAPSVLPPDASGALRRGGTSGALRRAAAVR